MTRRPAAVLAALAPLALAAATTSGCSSTDGNRGQTAPSAANVVTPPPPDATADGLISAATQGDAAAVRRLLDAGVAVDGTDSIGRTALTAASYRARHEVTGLLVAAGADVNFQDASRQSAYLIATSEIGPDDGLELLRLTLAHGADLAALDGYNGTGLIRAAHRGYVEIVRELLQTGIEVDHVNRLGWTALLDAIILGNGGPAHTEIVRQLLDAGADPNLADNLGVTPLAHAQTQGHEEIAQLLLNAGRK